MMKKVVIVTTGGTIAAQRDEAAGGALPALGAADFLAALPPSLAEVEVLEFCNLPSAHFTLETIWGLSQRVTETVEQSDVDGVVVTHGTDTMEETAYLLDLVVDTEKPMALTGAMRTASQVGYDGIANLAAAVRTAASPAARGLGALVVMNDEIHAARYVTKTHTLSPATFQSPAWGPLGRVDGDGVIIGQRVTRQRV